MTRLTTDNEKNKNLLKKNDYMNYKGKNSYSYSNGNNSTYAENSIKNIKGKNSKNYSFIFILVL